MAQPMTIHGSGSVGIAAYGVADAEARIEKELKQALPGAAVTIREVRRSDPRKRIVEEFEVAYTLRATVLVPEDEIERGDPRRWAFRTARRALDGSRFARTVWERAELENE